MNPPSCPALLLSLCGQERLELDPEGVAQLKALEAEGLLQRVSPPRQRALDAQFDALRGRHRLFLEAKGIGDRLARRLAPRTRLGGLLPSAQPERPGERDPDVARLFELLGVLGLEVRDVDRPAMVVSRLERIRDHLMVDDRDCLDRMTAIDRELASLQGQPPPGILVEPEGWFALTEAGEARLPETGVLLDLEAAFNALAGSRRTRIDDYAYFRDDPATLLAFLLETPAGHPSGTSTLGQRVADYEALAQAFEKVAAFADIRSFRVRNAFLVRLLRCHRDDPKAPWLWCSRERLAGLLDLTRGALPASLVPGGWIAVHAVDLFLAGGEAFDAERPVEARLALLEAVRGPLGEGCRGLSIGDGQFTRLALAMLHAVAGRGFNSALLRDRFIHLMVESTLAGREWAPADLADEGARLLLGHHLAHLGGFQVREVEAKARRLQGLLGGLRDPQGRLRLPVHAAVHALSHLERRGNGGLDAETLLATQARILMRLRRHRELARAFAHDQVVEDDEACLSLNLATRVHGIPGEHTLREVGLAGIYEGPDGSAPLGLAFGSLLLG